MGDLLRRLRDKVTVQTAVSMASHTSFKAGGEADLLILPKGEEELQEALALLRECAVPFYIMGNGSNILVRDGGFHGAIVKIAEGFDGIEVHGESLVAGAGALLSVIARAAAREALTGLEFAAGIPGSLGGAVYMNAGAYDGEMKNVLRTVRLLNPATGQVRETEAEDLALSYRYSRLYETGEVVLAASMGLTKGDVSSIEAKMRDFAGRRSAKQPLSYPSAGSFFKRPKGYYAGTLIEEAGLKGLTVGGAQVSTLHAGFLINIGGATATDIETLMHLVQARVLEQAGVALTPEVRIIGDAPRT